MKPTNPDPRLSRLLREIEQDAVTTEHWTGRRAFAPAVMSAIATVPRHEFAGPDNAALAYENRPLPVGHGQTISQPYIVALMTDLLDIQPTDRVLEIGTGSGYQAAVLACLADHVFTVEFVPELAVKAEERFRKLGCTNISVRTGDGREGWLDQAPFDAIIVTAVAETIPPAQIEQLKPGGRLVIPVGDVGGHQVLTVGHKNAAGEFSSRSTIPVAFVPLVSSNPDT